MIAKPDCFSRGPDPTSGEIAAVARENGATAQALRSDDQEPDAKQLEGRAWARVLRLALSLDELDADNSPRAYASRWTCAPSVKFTEGGFRTSPRLCPVKSSER